jgi:hypothetical protein
MKPPFRTVIVFCLFAGLLPAQDLVKREDFLTDHEVDVIREAQDPNDRIEVYLHFAHLRLELVRQALETYKPGRSPLIHRNLDEYGRIIETIDLVVDDALARDVDVKTGLAKAAAREAEFLTALEKILADPQQDSERYQFVLENAVEITQDSMDLAQEDLGERKREILEADQRERKERLESMEPQLRKEVAKQKKEQQREEAERERKRPTLLKPGETKKTP